MSRISVAAAVAVLSALAALDSPSSPVRADDAPLLVRSAKVLERPVAGVLTPSTVVLRGAFAPSGSYAALHRESDELAVDVGGTEIVRTDRGADGARLRFRRRGWAWSYAARSADAPRSTSTLAVDFLRGTFRARCSGAAVAELMADGAEGVPVTLRLGDTEISATIDFTHRGRAWRYRAPARGVPRDPPTGGTGDGGGDGTTGGSGSGGTQPPTGPVSFRSLGGDFVGGTTGGGVTASATASDFAAQWAARTSSIPLPQVDFSTEMVVFVDLGVRSTGGYSVQVTGVRGTSSGGVIIDYTETQPGQNCFVTMAITQVWTAVAVPNAVGGTLTGNKTVVVQTCQ